MAYNIIQASKEQQDALLNKHMKKSFNFFTKLFNSKKEVFIYRRFSYDVEDNIGFVSLTTWTDKKISYQLRGDNPCFVEFTGFGNIRYEIDYPSGEIFEILKEEGIKIRENFWKGGNI